MNDKCETTIENKTVSLGNKKPTIKTGGNL